MAKIKKLEDLELPFYLEPKLVYMIYLLTERCTKNKPALDTHLIITGDEGAGKTTLSGIIGYLVSQLSGRSFSEKNFFFDLKKMLEFAKTTKEQIIIWDEPALDGLSTQWWNKAQQDWIKLLLMGRKNRHFIISNMSKFWKFSEYIVVDRSIGLIHVYSRDNKQNGRFLYIKKEMLPYLYNDYVKRKLRSYKKFHFIHGNFPDAFNEMIGINFQEYDKLKSDAILSIGDVKKEDIYKQESKFLKWLIYQVTQKKNRNKSQQELENEYGLEIRTFENWARRTQNPQIPKSFEHRIIVPRQNLGYNGLGGIENQPH